MPELLTGRGGHVLKVVATAMGVRELVYSNAEAEQLTLAIAAAPCLAAPFAAPAAARRRGPSARSESLAAAG